jgi:hypothetical protein
MVVTLLLDSIAYCMIRSYSFLPASVVAYLLAADNSIGPLLRALMKWTRPYEDWLE